MITGGTYGMVFQEYSLRVRSSFSVVFCWSIVSKKTSSACALPVDSKFTSIGLVRISSLILGIYFQ